MSWNAKGVRTAVIAENLFVQSFKKRTYQYTDKYILGKRIEGINIPQVEVTTEITNLEQKFKDSGECSFVLDPSTSPHNLKTILQEQGYLQDLNYDDVWWMLDLGQFRTVEPKPSVATLSLIDNYSELQALLVDTPLDWWTDVFGICLTNKLPELTVKLYVGTVQDQVVSTCATAFYKNIAIYKGAEVIESHRRQGINTQMMLQSIDDAQKLGCSWYVYQTSSTNIASINTGKKLGFVEAFKREVFCKALS